MLRRWAGVLVAAHAPLLVFGPLSVAGPVLGALLALVGGGWIAVSVLRSPPPARVQADADAPACSPDGNRIAFVRERHHGKKPCRSLFSCYEIYAMNANGQASERLTNDRVADFNPDWQPLSPPRRPVLQGER